MKRPKRILLAACVLVLATLACNAALPQTEPTSVPTQVPTRILAPTQVQVTELAPTQPPASLPQTDAQVSRVPPDQAKTAFDGGDAIIVDVRGPDAYAQKHITGALEISLGTIELDPASLTLDKTKWIITYCT